MKKLYFCIALALSFTASANKVDYTHCQDRLRGVGYGNYAQPEGYPFKIEDDGKIKPHSSITSYQVDKDSKAEVMKISSENFGMQHETEFKVLRDDQGNISQIVQSSKTKSPKTKSGLGSPNNAFPYAGMGGGMGFGYGMGGIPAGEMEITQITDIKIKNGKCYPYRSYSINKNGNHEHKSFNEDVLLCRDIVSKLSDEQKENSRLAELKSCHDKYQNEAEKILNSHKERNADLYQIEKSKAQFSDGQIGGYPGHGSYGPGGFGMSIDSIVNSAQFSPSEKLKMLTVYCMFPESPMEKMVKDEKLFEKAPKLNSSGQEGSPNTGSPAGVAR